MPKPRPISGFPEWTPAQTLAEQRFLRSAIAVYESYGYTPLDTPAVERVEVLAAKGVVDKEIYALERLKEESRKDGPPELGLRFDHTIPLARYVGLHYGELHFPFKRYQVGKVWRGERPQEGRFREFYQADIDVIAEESLPLHFDAEMPRVILEIFARAGLTAQVRINNRKLLLDCYRGLGIPEETLPEVLREADKLDKIGPDELSRQLQGLGLSPELCAGCLKLASTRGELELVRSTLEQLGLPTSGPGWQELCAVANDLTDLSPDSWCVDLGIVRGLDYYTGTIYETFLPDHPELGSVCSGGRYEDLASGFINKKLPGVGISIGISRLVSHLLKSGALDTSRHCPTQVLIILPEESSRTTCLGIAKKLREAGVATEIYHQAQKLQKQIRYADRKGIPMVLFPHRYSAESPRVEIKNLADGSQVEVELESWLKSSGGPTASPAP
jgi:histidyl-tRNA synthetase